MGLSLDKVASLAATILKTDRRYVCVIQISIVTRVIDVMPEATYSPSSPGEPLEEEKTWFGTTFEYCEKMVEYAKNRDPTVKFMLEKIKEAGCPLADDFIKVQHCHAEVGGGFRAPDGVILCYNHLTSQEEVNHALTHELIHAYDHCTAKNLDWCNCTHHACSEIRAASLSGDCNYKMEVLRGHLGIAGQHQNCVKRRAELSVRMNPYCSDKGQAEKAVEEAFPLCFEDTRPFDRRP